MQGEIVLNVRLLGQFNVEFRGVPVNIPTRAYQSLLAWLMLTAGIEHRREHIATQFWPDATRENAFAYLRRGLWLIGTALAAVGADADDYLTADKLVIGFNVRASYALDVQTVEQAAQRVNVSTADLAHAASLYLGDLLPGFEHEDNTDDWVSLRRTPRRRPNRRGRWHRYRVHRRRWQWLPS